MNLLESIERFDKTLTKRLRLKGVTSEFQAYRVPLNSLRYNIENDRIATFISQYIDESGDLPEERETVNKIVESYIVASNPEAFKKTKANIKAIGQNEVAVIMSDGIVIDGNRRFTALRQLSNEGAGSEFFYIEVVILDRTKYEEKDIKRLELNLQHAIESKVDYNPIERLVGVYRDLIREGHPFSVDEYATETQIKPAKVQEEIALAKLLVEYLDFVNQPLKFHIARTQKIDGPLREIYKILKTNKIEEEDKDDVKEFLFANILTLDGDITRKIRDLKIVLEDSKTRDEILKDSEDALDDLDEFVTNQNNEAIVRETGIFNMEKDIKKTIVNISERYIEDSKLSTAKNQPVEALRKTLERIQSVDSEMVERMDGSVKNEFISYLENIIQEVDKIREILDVN